MRTILTTLAAGVALTAAASLPLRAQSPGQMLQGLLSGDQRTDQVVRDAYERGYRHGREDQARDDRARFERGPPPPPPPGRYPEPDPAYPRNPYGR